MPICDHCGTGLPVGHNFCYECGRPVGAAAPPAPAAGPDAYPGVDAGAVTAAGAPSQPEGWELPESPPQDDAAPQGYAPQGASVPQEFSSPVVPGAMPPPQPGAYPSPQPGAYPPTGAPPTWPAGPWAAGAPGGFAAAAPAAFRPEGWGKRTVAAIIDATIVFMLFVIGLAAWMIATGRIDSEGQITTGNGDVWNPADFSFAQQMLLTLALVVAFYVIQVFEEGVFSTTLGKLVFGLRVIGPDGRRCGFGRALVRNLVKAPAISLSLFFLPAAFLLFLVPVLSDKERRRSVGDRMAHTEVGKPIKAPPMPPGWSAGAPPGWGPGSPP